MSKKLLSEAQVRRFQALATIKPINEMAYNEEEKVEETYNEELVNEEEEMEMDAEEPEMNEADVEMDEELVEKFMDAVSTIQQVADTLGGEVDADMGDDMDLDMKADDEDLGDDAPMPLDAGDEEGEEQDEEEMLQEALSGINYIPSQKEIVKTVAQRVAKRLNEAKRAQARLNRALGKK